MYNLLNFIYQLVFDDLFLFDKKQECETSMETDTVIWSVNHLMLRGKLSSCRTNRDNTSQTSPCVTNSVSVQMEDRRTSTLRTSITMDYPTWFVRPTLARDTCFWVAVFSDLLHIKFFLTILWPCILGRLVQAPNSCFFSGLQ